MNGLRTKLEEGLGRGILALLFVGCLLVLWPFMTALLWATVLTFSLWPLYRRLAKLLGERRKLAAITLSLGLVLIVVLPFAIVGFTLGDNVSELETATRRWLEGGLPAAPAWLAKVPLVGKTAADGWNSLAGDSSKLVEKAKTLIAPVGSWLLSSGVKLGVGLVQFALSILLTFFLLLNGSALGATLADAIRRIGGERGAYLLELAGNTVRGVVYGILGTALVQAVMAGVGLVIAGVPGAGVLALLTFFLSVVPLGPPLVLVPAALWLFHAGSTGWGVFMLIWALAVSTADNFVKPWLISQGSDMPFVLIMFGVLGGALAFGFIGVFIGPTLLAVGHRLFREWSSAKGASQAQTTEKQVLPPSTDEPLLKE
jgi:predicted PurR-regulated permease PerM